MAMSCSRSSMQRLIRLAIRPRPAISSDRSRNRHMLRDIGNARNASFEISPMPLRVRTIVVSAMLAMVGTLSAAAQDAAVPREAQIGPRPFYLVDKMKEGPL